MEQLSVKFSTDVHAQFELHRINKYLTGKQE